MLLRHRIAGAVLAGSAIAAAGASIALAACGTGSKYQLNQQIITTQAAGCHARHLIPNDPQAWLPDPACTPGATDGGIPAAQLCPHAETKPVRPPTTYTNTLKRQQMTAYGFTGAVATFEEDHLISLELGGAPRDPKNLWPEPHQSPNEKDRVEDAAHTAVCKGTVSLADAQHRIASNWYQFGLDLGVLHRAA